VTNEELEERSLEVADIPAALQLSAEPGWNQVAADWRMFLDFGTAYAVRWPDRVVATAAWIPYGACAWISMVLVTAGERRHGLATRLLHRCIAEVTAAGLVPTLDATPAGAKVYAPLGFKAAWGFARFAAGRASVPSSPAVQIVIEPITDDAWPALCVYDTAVFGNDRSRVLARLRGRLPPANLVARREGRIAGMLLGREGRTASHLGPLTAEDDEVATALLTRALSRLDGTIYIDVADAKRGAHTFLESAGFTVQRPFTRMLLGREKSFDDTARTYAVIGPEFG